MQANPRLCELSSLDLPPQNPPLFSPFISPLAKSPSDFLAETSKHSTGEHRITLSKSMDIPSNRYQTGTDSESNQYTTVSWADGLELVCKSHYIRRPLTVGVVAVCGSSVPPPFLFRSSSVPPNFFFFHSSSVALPFLFCYACKSNDQATTKNTNCHGVASR